MEGIRAWGGSGTGVRRKGHGRGQEGGGRRKDGTQSWKRVPSQE